MFNYFHIENFRGLEDLEIDGLRPVNLIAGQNNVGKTALLEAIWLRYGYHNPSLPISADNMRGKERLDADEFLWDLFTRFDPERTIRLSAGKSASDYETLKITFQERRTRKMDLKDKGGDRQDGDTLDLSDHETSETGAGYEIVYDFEGREGRIEISQDEANIEEVERSNEDPNAIYRPSRTRPSNESLAQRLSRAKERKIASKLVDTIDVIEPSIRDVSVTYSKGSGPSIVCDVGWERLVPLGVMGEGVSRLLEISLSFVDCQGGALLIDEIENGLHHSVHKDIWRNLYKLADEFDTQVFATTHSYECIEAAHEAFQTAEEYDFQLIRLESSGERGVRPVQYDCEELEAAIEGGFEVR